MGLKTKTRERLIEIVGRADLIEEPRVLEEYAKDPANPVMVDAKQPVAVVKVESLEETQDVMTLLHEERIPVVPRSTGLDYHGNALPLVENAIVIDLSKMKKIVEINPTGERGMYAMVEPGVTFEALQRELDRYDARIPMPARYPAKASIVSTYTNNRPSFRSSSQGLYTYPMLVPTVELVTADGGVFRSGGMHAGVPTVSAVGMGLDRIPLGSLGTSGIITKAAVIFERKPKIRRVLFARFNDLDAATKVAERVLRYSSTEIGETHVVMNAACLASLLASSAESFQKTAAQLPAWTYAVCLSGPDEEWIGIQERHLAEIAEESRAPFEAQLAEAPAATAEILDEITMPSRISRVFGFRPHNRIEFYTSRSRIPRYDRLINLTAARHQLSQSFGIFLLPIEQARTWYVEYDLCFDPSDTTEVGRAREMLGEIFPKLIDAGATLPRSDYPVINRKLRQLASTYYDWMDGFKNVWDPHNLLNPGRLFAWAPR